MTMAHTHDTRGLKLHLAAQSVVRALFKVGVDREPALKAGFDLVGKLTNTDLSACRRDEVEALRAYEARRVK